MKVGIVVYSASGHTLSVATALQAILTSAGHGVTLERIETAALPGVKGNTALSRPRPPSTSTKRWCSLRPFGGDCPPRR